MFCSFNKLKLYLKDIKSQFIVSLNMKIPLKQNCAAERRKIYTKATIDK